MITNIHNYIFFLGTELSVSHIYGCISDYNAHHHVHPGSGTKHQNTHWIHHLCVSHRYVTMRNRVVLSRKLSMNTPC